MKKNFMAIAALLIAAMLLVVSCSQEVAPKADVDNGLVEAKIGVGISSRDIAINAADGNTNDITYKYTLEPMWQELENGTPIVGKVTSETELGKGNLSEGLTTTNTNKLVTPGLWKVTVFGYVTVGSEEKLVIKGA